MATTRYTFDPEQSRLWVDARSNLHPINSETRGLKGWVEAAWTADGALDLTAGVRGELQLATDHLSSGNPLYDRELRRRIDARRYPLIEGTIVQVTPGAGAAIYLVEGDLSFHGSTRRFAHEMTITRPDERSITLGGGSVFDIRQFGLKPPSMLMLKVYPEISVRVTLHGTTP